MATPPKVQNDVGDALFLHDLEYQVTGDLNFWVKDGKRINWYGDVYVNDVKIDEIEGIQGPPGQQGIPGPAGDAGAIGYIHTQASPNTVWTINHNLGFRPSVEVLDAGQNKVNAQVTHPTVNQTVVTFNTAQSGLARLN